MSMGPSAAVDVVPKRTEERQSNGPCAIIVIT